MNEFSMEYAMQNVADAYGVDTSDLTPEGVNLALCEEYCHCGAGELPPPCMVCTTAPELIREGMVDVLCEAVADALFGWLSRLEVA